MAIRICWDKDGVELRVSNPELLRLLASARRAGARPEQEYPAVTLYELTDGRFACVVETSRASGAPFDKRDPRTRYGRLYVGDRVLTRAPLEWPLHCATTYYAVDPDEFDLFNEGKILLEIH